VGTIALAVVVVAVLAVAVATPGLLRRRRLSQEANATKGQARRIDGADSPPSAGDAVDDVREHSG